MVQLKPLQSVQNQLHVLEVPGVTRGECFSSSDPVTDVEGLVLSKSCNMICDVCRPAIRDGKIPKNTLASGLWVGDVPSVLSELHFVE